MSKVDPQIMTDVRPEVYTEQSYLDIFPKEKIVYLSPDSRYLSLNQKSKAFNLSCD